MKLGMLVKQIIILIAVVLSVFFLLHTCSKSEATEWSYPQFLSSAKQGEIQNIVIDDDGRKINGELEEGEKVFAIFSSSDTPAKDLREIEITDYKVTKPSSNWTGFIWWIIFGLIFFLFLLPVLRERGMGGIGGANPFHFAQSRAKMITTERPKVSFQDVAGADEAKEELQEIVGFLKNPIRYLEIGARIPKGVLLSGPPGTGKTLLARAVAGEAGVPFFSCSGSEFVEMFVGVGAARIRDLFSQAKQNSPSVVFMDEIDAMGRHRGAGLGGGHDEREQTLNQIFTEMDGFDERTNVIVIAATNRPDILDPALLRPGRFDRQVVVDRPDLKGREAILKVHALGKHLTEDVNLETLAKETPGFTGADLENILNEAAILTARSNKREIGMKELDEAIDRVGAGPQKKSRIISEKEKKIIACHESGHALVAHYIPEAEKVYKISAIPRGMMGGYTKLLPEEDRFILNKDQLEAKLSVLLAGREAEELTLGVVSTGAANDLEEVKNLARKMVTEYGMSEKLAPQTFGKREGLRFLGKEIAEERNYSEKIAEEIDEEVNKIINQAHQRAKEILEQKREKLEETVKVLLEKETLEGEFLEKLLSD